MYRTADVRDDDYDDDDDDVSYYSDTSSIRSQQSILEDDDSSGDEACNCRDHLGAGCVGEAGTCVDDCPVHATSPANTTKGLGRRFRDLLTRFVGRVHVLSSGVGWRCCIASLCPTAKTTRSSSKVSRNATNYSRAQLQSTSWLF